MIERMFDIEAAWQAEDEFALALTEKLESELPEHPRRPGLPSDLEFLPPDIRLAVVLMTVDVDRLSDRDRVRYL